MATMKDYRILDKDLGRITRAEGASHVAARPLRRAGMIAAALLAVLAVLSALLGQGLPASAPVVIGFSVAIYLGLNIGANDVANSAGPAFGARAMPLGLGLAGVALAQIAGALIAGQAVTETIAR
ncbi:MAG: inorganic phosphate transporter, partial [Paracoccus sp. (in: a-proteobacteria)]|nr:inorganic phosphate transporter [Paracoccus sp. (in: a-proteobacteria)]